MRKRKQPSQSYVQGTLSPILVRYFISIFVARLRFWGRVELLTPEIRHVVRGGRGSPLTHAAVRIVNARNETSAPHIHVALVLSRRDFTNAPAIASFFCYLTMLHQALRTNEV
jgi:hypothetical protein